MAEPYVFFCPSCNRRFESRISATDVEEVVKKHVINSHPDYDPFWFETYPDGLKD